MLSLRQFLSQIARAIPGGNRPMMQPGKAETRLLPGQNGYRTAAPDRLGLSAVKTAGSERLFDPNGVILQPVQKRNVTADEGYSNDTTGTRLSGEATQGRRPADFDAVSQRDFIEAVGDFLGNFREEESQATMDRLSAMGRSDSIDWTAEVNSLRLNLNLLETKFKEYKNAVVNHAPHVEEIEADLGNIKAKIDGSRFQALIAAYKERVEKARGMIVPLDTLLTFFHIRVANATRGNPDQGLSCEVSFRRPEELKTEFFDRFKSASLDRLVQAEVRATDPALLRGLGELLEQGGFFRHLDDFGKASNQKVLQKLSEDQFSRGELMIAIPDKNYPGICHTVRVKMVVTDTQPQLLIEAETEVVERLVASAQERSAFVEGLLGRHNLFFESLGKEGAVFKDELRTFTESQLFPFIEGVTDESFEEIPTARRLQLAIFAARLIAEAVERKQRERMPAVPAETPGAVSQPPFIADADEDSTNPGTPLKLKGRV